MYLTTTGKKLSLTTGTNNWTLSGTAGDVRTGTDKNDIFYVTQKEKVVGGAGDDVYELWADGGTVVEKANGGNDTVYVRYWGGLVMPDNVENVVLSSPGATWATGNALDNLMIAGSVNARLDGGKGNDVLVGGSGADIFTIGKGNGSDVIMNFQASWDMIDIKSYGFTSFDKLKAASKQSGSDVVIKLGNGETLVLRDVSLASLHAEDFGLPMATIGQGMTLAAPDTKTLAAWKAQNYNGWIVHTNAWGSFSLKENVDFKLTGVFHTSDPTAGTTFQWSYAPSNSVNATILAYPELSFGHSPLDVAASNPKDIAHVFPVKVADMVQLTSTHDTTYSGNLAGFNVSYDIWLSRDPSAIGKDQVSNEIMIWVHKGGFEAFGKVVGSFTMGDATATIYHDGTYTALVFDQELPQATIDVAAVIQKLVELGIVSPEEYIRSLEFGAEVNGGQGALTINNLDLVVETRNADGSTTTKTVDGTGTTTTSSGTQPSIADKMAAQMFADIKDAGALAITDDNGNQIGTHKVTVRADGSLLIASFDLKGVFTSSQLVEKTGTTIQTQTFDAKGGFVGAERSVVAYDGAVTTTHYDALWKATGSEIVRTLGDGKVETQRYDGAFHLIGIEQAYVELNGGHTVLHFDATATFTGAETVYVKDDAVSTYHYDASWHQIDRVTVRTNPDDGGVKTSYYDSADRLVSAEYVLKTDDYTLHTQYNAKNQITGSTKIYTLDDGAQRSVFLDAKYKTLGERYDGTDGADHFTGSSKNTEWHLGAGADVVHAGSGVDRFFFDTALGKDQVDSIVNFAAGKDKIVLDHNIFTALEKAGALDPSSFVSGKTAKDANDHIIYDAATRSLYYDADGAGGADAVLVARIKVSGHLSASDFLIV